MEIKSKNDIIDYFASGIKQDELIGVENEQFLFNIKTKKRAEYENIKKLLQIFITKFGWQEIKENENLIGLKFNGKSIKDLRLAEKKLLKKDIQIVFQDPYGSLSPRMTVGEIIGEGLDIHFDFSNEEKIEKISNAKRWRAKFEYDVPNIWNASKYGL